RIAEALQKLEATRTAQRRRLEEVSVLARDIEEQLREVEKLETRKVSRFRDYLWVESARLEAERVFLERYVAELDRFLGPATALEVVPDRGPSVKGRQGSDAVRPTHVPTIRMRR